MEYIIDRSTNGDHRQLQPKRQQQQQSETHCLKSGKCFNCWFTASESTMKITQTVFWTAHLNCHCFSWRRRFVVVAASESQAGNYLDRCSGCIQFSELDSWRRRPPASPFTSESRSAGSNQLAIAPASHIVPSLCRSHHGARH